MIDLSHVFVWRGRVRYWDAQDARVTPRREKRNHKLHVRAGTYDKLKAIARRRGIAIQAVVDLVMADVLP